MTKLTLTTNQINVLLEALEEAQKYWNEYNEDGSLTPEQKNYKKLEQSIVNQLHKQVIGVA